VLGDGALLRLDQALAHDERGLARKVLQLRDRLVHVLVAHKLARVPQLLVTVLDVLAHVEHLAPLRLAALLVLVRRPDHLCVGVNRRLPRQVLISNTKLKTLLANGKITDLVIILKSVGVGFISLLAEVPFFGCGEIVLGATGNRNVRQNFQ